MEKFDARRISDKEKSLLRKQVISLRKKGYQNQHIAEVTGLAEATCSKWWTRYEKEGQSFLSVPKRGRKQGEKRNLSPEQENAIRKQIIDKCPDQLKLPFALWDRSAVGMLIEQQYGIKMPVRTIGLYLARWGFTLQRPTKKAYEQRPAEVEQWHNEEYPAFSQKAKDENGEIFWCDETGISTNGNLARGYAPVGQTPELRLNARKEHLNMISAVTNRGKIRWMIYDKAMNSDLLIEFMKRLIRSTSKKVFLIMDNLRVHHSQPVKDWLSKNSKNIEVEYLPAYSPEMNPDEYLNSDLKTAVHGNSGSVARTKKQITDKTVSRLEHLKKNPKKVKGFFKHPSVKYAAD